MKAIFSAAITLYQIILCPILRQLLGVNQMCRQQPSCSQYTKQVIKKYGIIKGTKLGLIKLANCQPWGKKIYGRIF